eukprot:GDKJ01036853.1.p1 GENE.GDKJ01036853.1~~GDKJ01036853.1.p1  ORF type:complete len:1095 (-),score=208.51 GDKJ01036853.1:41-3325(-)
MLKAVLIIANLFAFDCFSTCLVPKARLVEIINRRYEMKELLGTGYFGEVYRAVSKTNKNVFALKTFKQKAKKQCYSTWAQVGEDVHVREIDIPNLVHDAATPAQRDYFVPIIDQSPFQPWETAFLTMELLDPSQYSLMNPTLTDRSVILLSLYISVQAIHAYSALLSAPSPLVHRDVHFGNVQYRLKDWRFKLYDFSLGQLCSRLHCPHRDLKTMALWVIIDAMVGGGLNHAETLVNFWEKNVLAPKWQKASSKCQKAPDAHEWSGTDKDEKRPASTVSCTDSVSDLPPVNHAMRRGGRKVGIEKAILEGSGEGKKNISYLIMKSLENWLSFLFFRPEILNSFDAFFRLCEEITRGEFDMSFFLANYHDDRYRVAVKKFFSDHTENPALEGIFTVPWEYFDQRERIFETPFKRVKFANGELQRVSMSVSLNRSTKGQDGSDWFTAEQILANSRVEVQAIEHYPLDLNPVITLLADYVKTGKHNALTRKVESALLANGDSGQSRGSDALTALSHIENALDVASGKKTSDQAGGFQSEYMRLKTELVKGSRDSEEQNVKHELKRLKKNQGWSEDLNREEMHFAWNALKLATKVSLFGKTDSKELWDLYVEEFNENILKNRESSQREDKGAPQTSSFSSPQKPKLERRQPVVSYLSPSTTPCDLLDVGLHNALDCETDRTVPTWFLKRAGAVMRTPKLLREEFAFKFPHETRFGPRTVPSLVRDLAYHVSNEKIAFQLSEDLYNDASVIRAKEGRRFDEKGERIYFDPLKHSFASETCRAYPCSVREGCDPPGRFPILKYPSSNPPENNLMDLYEDERWKGKDAPVLTFRGLVMGWADIPRQFEELERGRLIYIARGGWSMRMNVGMKDWGLLDIQENGLSEYDKVKLPQVPPLVADPDGKKRLDYGGLWSPSGLSPLYSVDYRVEMKHKKVMMEHLAEEWTLGDPEKLKKPLRRDDYEYRHFVGYDPDFYDETANIKFNGVHIPCASEIIPDITSFINLVPNEKAYFKEWSTFRDPVKREQENKDRLGREIIYDGSKRVGFGDDMSNFARRLVLCHPYVRSVRGVVARWLGRSENKLINLPSNQNITACQEFLEGM